MSFIFVPPVTPTPTVPGGASTNVQYNNSGSFAGSANFAYISGTNTLTTGNITGSALAMVIKPKTPTVSEIGDILTLGTPNAVFPGAPGGDVEIVGGNGDGGNSGGNINITAGRDSAQVTIRGGISTSFNAGAVQVIGGASTNATGGPAYLFAGGSSTGAGGDVIVQAGSGATQGSVTIRSGTGSAMAIACNASGGTQRLAFFATNAATQPIAQPTTGTTAATFVANASANTLYNESTFDGYTLAKVVAALRNLRLLA